MTFRYSNSEYDDLFLESIGNFGGFTNAHAHLDRASTLALEYLQFVGIDPVEGASLPLRVKQNLIGDLHKGPAYNEDNLRKRIKYSLDRQCEMFTKTIYTMVDASPDIPDNGQSVLNIINEIKEEYKDKITIKVGITPIFGFKKPERLEVYKEAAVNCDFLGGLPEKDDVPDSIGAINHIKEVLTLGCSLNKEVHVHVDQTNVVTEHGTNLLIQGVKWIGSPKIQSNKKNKPTVWAIHVLSPSTYSEDRFNRMVDGLLENNIGVICCPSAALSMRQIRPLKSYTHNSIARVLEMLEAGVYVKIGTDNICDIFVPSSDGCMLTEVKILSHAIRFYVINILAKVASGHKINDMDREIIRRSLVADREVFDTYTI